MALYLDQSARDTLLQASSKIWGYNKYAQTSAFGVMAQYSHGTAATGTDLLDGTFSFTAALTKDATETLSTKNVPRLGDTYVAFVHPHQSRQLRDDPEWIEVTKYAAPGSFMIGEIGRLNDVVFIETTQVKQFTNALGKTVYQSIFLGDNAFGHAISLPVELRDGGILDFGFTLAA